MASFNLTAELNLRGPSNLNQVVSNIRRQLSTISLNLNINPSTSRGIQAVTADVRTLSTALRDAQANAVALSTTLRGLGAATSNVARATSSLGSNLGSISGQASGTATAIKAASSEMTEFGRQSALAVRRFAAFSVATGAIYALSRAITSAYGEFVNFNKEFVRLQQVTDSTASGLTSLSNEITRLSSSLGVSSQELLQVSVTLAQAGLSAGETKTALEALAKSALAPSFDSLNDTVEGSIALMRQFGISAADLEGSLGSVNAVAAKFAVEASDIIAAIQRTGGVFANASKGVSEGKDALNEFLAVFTSVRATTRESAETIATGLRTIFTRIQRTGTIDALKQYGISLTDLEGKFVGPYEAVRRLSEGLKALDPRDLRFSSIVEELGGFRQIGKVIPLIQQFETAQKALGVAQRGAGSLAIDAATAQEALSVRINKVREQFVALIRDIGQSQGFQTFVDISLKLASALISVADAAKDVLPAIAAITAIRGVGALGQFFGGFTGGLGRNKPRGFAKGGFVPGKGNGDTVPAMLTPGEFVIRKKAVENIGVGNLSRMNKYASGGMVQKFAMGGRSTAGIRRGSRSRFKELTQEEISQLSTADLIKYAKAQARDIFTSGGAGMATSSKFIPVPQEKIVPELESSLQTYLGKKGFWQEQVSPFGRPGKKLTSGNKKISREKALDKQESRLSDEVAARAQQWTKIRSGSPIDGYLMSSLKEPILSDYRTVRSGSELTKPFYNTRLRQAVNKALEQYDDFDYSSGNVDKFVSAFAAKKFADGGWVQKFAQKTRKPNSGMVRPVKLKDLMGLGGQELLGEASSYGISVSQMEREAAKSNKRYRTEEQDAIRSALIKKIEKARSVSSKTLATKKAEQDVKSGNVMEFAAAGLRYAGSFPSGSTGVTPQTQQTVRIYSGSLKKKQGDKLEKILYSDFTSSVKKIAGSLAGSIRATPNFGEIGKVIKNSGFYNVIGSALEAATGLIGAPYVEKTEENKSIDFPGGLGAASRLFNLPKGDIPTDVTRTLGGYGKNFSSMLGQIDRYLKNYKKFPVEKFALGGDVSGEDTVPALLTPGEFVINKKAAKRLGGAKLNKLNNADKISGFNKGGAVGHVQRFAVGGSALPARPTASTPFNMVVPPDTVSALQEIAKALENMGVSASESARILERGGAVSVNASERAYQADLNRLRIAGASATDIYNAEQRLAQVREQNATKIRTSEQFSGLTGDQLQDIQSGAELGRQRIIENRRSVMQSRGRSANEIQDALADSDFQDYARRTAFERSTATVTGRSTRDLQRAGIGGQDIEAYVNQSMMDTSTLRQMDQQLLETRRNQLRNDAAYTSASAAQQRRMMRELNARTNEELAARRDIVNQLRRDRGLSGGFLGREGAGLSRVLGAGQTGMALLGMGQLREDAFGQGPRGRRFATGFNRMSAGMQGAGMGLTFAGGMIGDTIGKAMGGKEGQALSSAVSAFVGSAGIGMMFGPIGALTGVVVGATTAIDAWRKSVIESTLQEEAAKIEDAQQKLQTSFEKIGKAKGPEEAQIELKKAAELFQKISVAESNRQSELGKNTLPSMPATFEEGMLSGISGIFTNIGRSLTGSRGRGAWWDPTGYSGELLDPRATAMPQLEKEVVSSAKQTNILQSLPQQFELGIEKGLSLTQIQASFAPGQLDQMKELFAVASAGPDMRGDAGAVARLVAQRESLRRAGKDTSSVDATIKNISDRLFNQEFLKGLQDRVNSEKAIAAASAAATIEIDLLNQVLSKIGSAANKAGAQFEEAQRQIAIQQSVMFGGGQVQGPDRSQENVLENVLSYSFDEIRDVINQIGSEYQFNPAIVTEAQNSAVNQKILQQELPRILAEVTAREGEGFDPEGGSADVIRKKLEEVFSKFVPDEKLRKPAIERVMTNLTERLKSRKGTTVEDLAGDEAVFADIAKNAGVPLETFISLLKQTNDIVGTVNASINEWVSNLSSATDMRIDAQNISIEAGNQLSKVLGEELSLGDMNQAFENTISTLTQRIGAGGAGVPGTGTLDPGTIMQRMLEREKDARDIQSQLDKEKPPVGSARFNELSESLKRAKLEAGNLSRAHQKLQNDSSRAANALTKIGELKQVQDAKQSSLLDLLKNVNDPEAMMQFTNEVQSFFAQMAGQGSRENLPAAIAGLERQMAVLPAEQAQAIRDDFIKSLEKTRGLDPEALAPLKAIIGNVTGVEVSPEMKGLIGEFYKYTDVQKEAIMQASDALVAGANKAAKSLVDAGIQVQRTVSAAGQDNPREVVPMQPQNNSKGGLIYASKGQYVNYQPRGTDTVPAMLTPGEFVVNAKATKKNIGLLKAINNGSKSRGSNTNLNYYNEGGLVDPDLRSLIGILYDTPDSENMTEDDLYDRLKTGGIPLIADSQDTERLYNFKDAYEKRKRDQEESAFQQQRSNEDQQRQSEINTRKQRDAAAIASTEADLQKSRIETAEAKKQSEQSSARLEELRKQEKERKEKNYEAILANANKTEQQKLEDRRRRFPEIAWSRPKTEADLASIAAGTNPGVNKSQKIQDLFDTDPLFEDYRYNENLASTIKTKIAEMYSDDLDDHMPTMSSLLSLARTTSLDFAKQTRESAERKQLARQEQNRAMIASATASFVGTLGDRRRYDSAFRATYLGDKSAQLHIKDAEKEGVELQKNVGEMVEKAKNYEGPLGMLAYTGDNIVSGVTSTIGAPGGDERNVADIKDRMDKYKQKQIEAGNTDFSWENHTNPIISALGTTGRYTGELFGGTVGSALNTIGGTAMLSASGYAGAFGFDEYAKSFEKKGFEAFSAAGSDFYRAMEQTGRGVAGLGERAMGYDDPTQLLKGKTQGQLLDERNVQEAGQLGTVVRFSQIARDTAGEGLLPFPGLGKKGASRSIAGRMDDLDPAFTRQRGIPTEGVDANLFDNRNVKFPTGSGSNVKSRLTFGNTGDLLDQERINTTLGHLTSFRTGVGKVATKGMDLAETGLMGARDLATKGVIDAGLLAGKGVMGGLNKSADFAKNIMGYFRGSRGPFMAGRKTKKYPFYDPRRWLGLKQYDTMTKKAMQTSRAQKRAGKKTTPTQQQLTPKDQMSVKTTRDTTEQTFKPQEEPFDLGDDLSEEVNKILFEGKFITEDEYYKILKAKQLQEQTQNMVAKGKAPLSVTGTSSPKAIAKIRDAAKKAQERAASIFSRYASSPEKAKEIIEKQDEIFGLKGIAIDPTLKSKVNVVSGKTGGVGGEYRPTEGTIAYPSIKDSTKGGLLHEVLHASQKNIGTMQGGRDPYKFLRADSLEQLRKGEPGVHVGIDEFLKPGGAYERLIKDTGRNVDGAGFYSAKDVANSHFELLTALGQSADTKAFKKNKEAQDLLRAIIKAMGYKKGGPVYASNGTLVPYQPKGTDTVPAMLTPGEFVVNARATKKNLGLLKAINGGAKGYSKGGVAYLEDGGRVRTRKDLEEEIEAKRKEREEIESKAKAKGKEYDSSVFDGDTPGHEGEGYKDYEKQLNLFRQYAFQDLIGFLSNLPDGPENESLNANLNEFRQQMAERYAKMQKDNVSKVVFGSASVVDQESIDEQLKWMDPVINDFKSGNWDAAAVAPDSFEKQRTAFDDVLGQKKLIEQKRSGHTADSKQSLFKLGHEIKDSQDLLRDIDLLQDKPNAQNEARINYTSAKITLEDMGIDTTHFGGGFTTDEIDKGLESPDFEAKAAQNKARAIQQLKQRAEENLIANNIDWKEAKKEDPEVKAKNEAQAQQAEQKDKPQPPTREDIFPGLPGSTPTPDVKPSDIGTKPMLSEAAKTALDTIKTNLGLMSSSTMAAEAMMAKDNFIVGIDDLSKENFKVDLAPITDILNASKEQILEARTNNIAALQNFYDTNVLPALGDMADQAPVGVQPNVVDQPIQDPYAGMTANEIYKAKKQEMREAYKSNKQSQREAFRSRTGRDPNTGRIGGTKVELTDEQKADNKRRAEIRATRAALGGKKREDLTFEESERLAQADIEFNNSLSDKQFKNQQKAEKLARGESLLGDLSPEQIANRQRAERLALGAIDPKQRTEGQQKRYNENRSEFLANLSPEQTTNRERAERLALNKIDPENRSFEQQELLDILKTATDQRTPEQIEQLEELRRQKLEAMYASKGTLVPYQPRGTDTVPAMLTPGEFVVNRKSAKQNMGLLKAINNGHNVKPLGFNKGGVVPTKYYEVGGNVSAGSSGGGGVSSISVDASSLDAAFSNFNSYVSSLSSVIDGFTQGTTELAGLSQAISGLGNLGLREGASLMANAGISVKEATTAFSSAMTEFNTAASSLATAIGAIPQSISLTVSGSIPVTVSVQIEGGSGTGTDTAQLEQSIMDKVALAINTATQGGIVIDTAIA